MSQSRYYMGIANTNDNAFHLTPIQKNDWQAAHILYANRIPACLVGPPASAFYGSDDLWIQVIIVVLDSAFEDAHKVLLANGYEDFPMDDDAYMMRMARASGAYGPEPVEWHLLSSQHCNDIDIILAPASHWHFNITEDTTIVVDGIRLPKYASYLEALASVLAQRHKFAIPPGCFQLQAVNAWVLRGKYPDALKELSPADKLFLDHYFSLRRLHNLRKVVELWDGLRMGLLTVDEAMALAPVEKILRRLPSGRLRNGVVNHLGKLTCGDNT